MKKKQSWSANQLKYGDVITIETTGNCTLTDGNDRHITAAETPLGDGFRYTLTVTKDCRSNQSALLSEHISAIRSFDITLDAAAAHGTCSYQLDGDPVSGTISLRENQKLTATYKLTDSDYEFKSQSKWLIGLVRNFVNSSECTVEIPITAELDGTVISPDDWFEPVQKGA